MSRLDADCSNQQSWGMSKCLIKKWKRNLKTDESQLPVPLQIIVYLFTNSLLISITKNAWIMEIPCKAWSLSFHFLSTLPYAFSLAWWMFQHLIVNVTLKMKDTCLSLPQGKGFSLLYLPLNYLIRNKIPSPLVAMFCGILIYWALCRKCFILDPKIGGVWNRCLTLSKWRCFLTRPEKKPTSVTKELYTETEDLHTS